MPWLQSVSREAVPPTSPVAGLRRREGNLTLCLLLCSLWHRSYLLHSIPDFLSECFTIAQFLWHSRIMHIYGCPVSTPSCTTLLLVLISKSLLSFLFLKSCTGLAPALQNLVPSLLRGFLCFLLFDPLSILIFKLDFPSLLRDPAYWPCFMPNVVVCCEFCLLCVPGLYLVQIRYMDLPCFYL